MDATQAEASGETKPKFESTSIELVVKDQHGNEVHFKVNLTPKSQGSYNCLYVQFIHH
jgi:hypothetical protein